MKKIIISILLAISVVTCSAVLVSADNTEIPSEAEAAEVQTPENTDKESAPKKNIFETAYEEILKESDKLLAAMAALSSLFLALAYKKGLLPIIKGALSTLAAQVAKFKEDTQREIGKTNDSAIAINQKLTETENILELLTEKLDLIEGELSESSKQASKSESLAKIMNVQVDLLYDIFMSSSLPQYQKEIVGEKIVEMKRTISGDEKNEK